MKPKINELMSVYVYLWLTDVKIKDFTATSGEDFADIWSLTEKDLWWSRTGQHQRVINMPLDGIVLCHATVTSHITSSQIS